MSESDALIYAVQHALKDTERQAHRILDLSSSLLVLARQYELTGNTRVCAGFLREWSDLCGVFRDFWACYAGRSHHSTFIPGQFRPHEFLACVATTSEVMGVVGRSLCHIAYKYGWEVRYRIRQVVPREATRPRGPTTDPQPPFIARLADAPGDTQGGFGFPITDVSIPAVQAALRKFEAWDPTTVKRVKIGITQEVGRGWLQVPVTIRAMSEGVRESDEKEPAAPSRATSAATNPDTNRVEGTGAGSSVVASESFPASGSVPPANLQAAHDAVATLVRCLDKWVKSFRDELRSGPKAGSLSRENLVTAVEELGPLITDADEKVAPVRVELQDARGMIPSVHEEVIEFARNFRRSAESLAATGEELGKTAVQVWLVQASQSVDGFLGGIVNPRFNHTTRSGIDFEMTQAALRRARNTDLACEATTARSDRDLQVRAELDRNPTAPQEANWAGSPTAPRNTLGHLILALEGVERDREFSPLRYQERARRDPIWAHMARGYESALAWRPDEAGMPGISRIELLCDLEPGEAGINAAKVRRLRARICQHQGWRPQHADQLTLNEAADLLEGIRRVSLEEQQRAGQDAFHHGLATIDTICVALGEEVQVTGLSCKVIAGTTPTACPDANPALPPSMLPVAERAIRHLNQLPAGTTIHWVGHDTGYRNRCRCHPNAPFAAPFDQNRWATIESTPGSEQLTTGSVIPAPKDILSPPTSTSRPAAATDTNLPVRIRCDESDRSVYLDGKHVVGEVELAVFRFFKAIAEAYPDPISYREIARHVLGLHGKHPTRDLKNRLPSPLDGWIESGKHGYSLKLPPPKSP